MNSFRIGTGLVERETGTRYEDVVSFVAKDSDTHVNGARASTGQDDILSGQWGLWGRELVGNGLTGLWVTGGGWVSVGLVGLKLLYDGIRAGLVDLEVAKERWVAEGKRDHRLFRVGLDLDVINDGTDGIRGALRDDRGGDFPRVAWVGGGHDSRL